MTIDATERAERVRAIRIDPSRHWATIAAWAQDLVEQFAIEPATQHIAIFVPDATAPDQLRLAAQIWGAGEDTGEVVAGSWTIPLEGSVCGRVFRTGRAALCADVAMDPDFRTFPGGMTRSFLTVPVGSPDDVVGVINLEAPRVSAFSIRDYERVTDCAAIGYRSFPRGATA